MSTLNPGWALPGVASPCIGVCRLDATGRSCLGCLRTVEEIAEWPTASDARRRAILERLEQARAAAPPGTGGIA